MDVLVEQLGTWEEETVRLVESVSVYLVDSMEYLMGVLVVM